MYIRVLASSAHNNNNVYSDVMHDITAVPRPPSAGTGTGAGVYVRNTTDIARFVNEASSLSSLSYSSSSQQFLGANLRLAPQPITSIDTSADAATPTRAGSDPRQQQQTGNNGVHTDGEGADLDADADAVVDNNADASAMLGRLAGRRALLRYPFIRYKWSRDTVLVQGTEMRPQTTGLEYVQL